ncbi:GNAT family N-acetyltransferase [Kitasatospora sp. NPDC059571]|uniref:GNAT family N-acetyltransferase n=1 Tax=Kitasatospora sp. NPDC059571 TaxID=3346871 RepID=UPI0036775DDC
MDLPPQVIELDDLTLRSFHGEADAAELFGVIEEALEHLRPWVSFAAEHSWASTLEFLARRPVLWASGQAFTYAIVLDGAIVGSCGLFRRTDTPDNGREIGYWLHPAATGRGVATRAVRALCEQAFRLAGVDHVEIVHDAANHASGAVPARLGFTEHLRRPARPLAPADTGEDRIWRLTRPHGSTPAATRAG